MTPRTAGSLMTGLDVLEALAGVWGFPSPAAPAGDA